MALKSRELVSQGGPDGQSAWQDSGDNCSFPAQTITTSWPAQPFDIVPGADLQLAGGQGVPDNLPSGQAIQRLNGAAITLGVLQGAASTLYTSVRVMRNIGALTAQIANAGGALTSLPITANTALASGQTFVLTNAAGTAQTWTTSAAVKAGATSIPVTSTTPTGTNAIGNQGIAVVGNTSAFGWVTVGTGTPTLPADQSVPMPAIAANIALVTPSGGSGSYLPLFPGDTVELCLLMSAATLAVPAGVVSTQII